MTEDEKMIGKAFFKRDFYWVFGRQPTQAEVKRAGISKETDEAGSRFHEESGLVRDEQLRLLAKEDKIEAIPGVLFPEKGFYSRKAVMDRVGDEYLRQGNYIAKKRFEYQFGDKFRKELEALK